MLSLDIKNIKKGYEDKKEFQNIAKAIRKSKRCIVVTGAGISVSGGIPVGYEFSLIIYIEFFKQFF